MDTLSTLMASLNEALRLDLLGKLALATVLGAVIGLTVSSLLQDAFGSANLPG